MTNDKLSELFINMEGLIFRVANVIVKYSPAAQTDMQLVFDEWNRIVREILGDKP